MNGLRALLLFALATALAVPARADDVAESKAYFRAGASAYEMGDYLAAIQALEAAYKLTPLPAIAFSLAQAERRQYLVSRDRKHLDRGIELYRIYLSQVLSGGRRADATDALGQLEALAAASTTSAEKQEPVQPDKTRVMISSSARRAMVSLDGAPDTPAPLIAQVTPGQHRVRVSAPGFFPSERTLVAIEGELLPLEVALREKPAVAVLKVEEGADVQVDGAYVGSVYGERRIELPAGTHRFSFTKNGYELETVVANFDAGEERTFEATLQPTWQRTLALSLFVAGAASVVTGAVLTGFAIAREDDAETLLAQQRVRNITGAELEEYEEAVRDRSRLRIGAGAAFGGGVAALLTGAFLYLLDQPELGESIEPSEPASAGAGIRPRVVLAGQDSRLELNGRF